MKVSKRSLLALILTVLGVAVMLLPVSVSAVVNSIISISNPPSKDASNSGGSIFVACQDINTRIRDNDIFKRNDKIQGSKDIDFLTVNYINADKVVNIEVNMIEYNNLGNQKQQKVMQLALDGINNSNISRTNKNKIYNELCNLDKPTSALVRQLSEDVTADFAGAYRWFRPFSGVLGWILGILALAIFVALAFTLVIDISFITLPFIQFALMPPDTQKRAKFVSMEAINAVKSLESQSGTNYVNPMGVYFKSKIKQFVAIFICLLYLLSGKIYMLLASVIDYFTTFVG